MPKTENGPPVAGDPFGSEEDLLYGPLYRPYRTGVSDFATFHS